MKKLFLLMCVCAGLCACSSDDDLVSSSSSEDLGQATAYLTVKIKDVNSSTRATSPSENPFAYGTEDEQKVNNAYFYFYDATGNYMAKGNATPTGTGKTSDTTADGNIEWNSETVVAVWGLTEGAFPTQMLTVLNKPTGIDFTGMSLETALATLAGNPYADASGNFVMSTSAYYDSGVVNTTALAEKNFAPEPVNLEGHYGEDGAYDAVDVYVERLAAKVGLSVDSSILWTNSNQFGTLNIEVTDAMFEDWAKAPTVAGTSDTYVIRLQGWDVDCVARDAYVVKDITPFATQWASTPGFSGWNDATDYRCYWAASPAYGDATVTYPKSSHGNTSTEEASESTWLNKYLRYTDLADPVDFGETTYCGENTNTAAVINANDSSINCLTNVLLKAQFGYEDNNRGTFTGVDIVKYHGEYLTLADFEADMITEVMSYDIRTLSQEVAEYLEDKYKDDPTIGGFVSDLAEAIQDDAVYMRPSSSSDADDFEVFDARFLQLINKGDGKVGIWFNTTTSVDTDGETNTPTSETKHHPIPDYYDSPIVKAAEDDMDSYTFAFKLDTEKLTSAELVTLRILGWTSGDYFLLGDNATLATITTEGGHTYTLHQYFIRAIEREAAGINDDWEDAGYPYFYNEGLMYYNVPIEHLGSAASDGSIAEGEYGVVRNHWYDITVTSISDFGHAIADEQEVIVPQVEENYYYAAATINILSWKMINQSVGW